MTDRVWGRRWSLSCGLEHRPLPFSDLSPSTCTTSAEVANTQYPSSLLPPAKGVPIPIGVKRAINAAPHVVVQQTPRSPAAGALPCSQASGPASKTQSPRNGSRRLYVGSKLALLPGSPLLRLERASRCRNRHPGMGLSSNIWAISTSRHALSSGRRAAIEITSSSMSLPLRLYEAWHKFFFS
jgi:hypothetical protein